MLNELRDEIFKRAAKQGFHGEGQDDLCKKLILVITECCEAVEAERKGIKLKQHPPIPIVKDILEPEVFAKHYRGTIEEEITDAVIRLFDIAGMIDMDLDWWIASKMAYNKSRPFRHNKLY